MNHNHKHDHCKHTNISYCSHCDVAYCKSCNREWVKQTTWTYGTTGGLALCGNDTSLTTSANTNVQESITTCNHKCEL